MTTAALRSFTRRQRVDTHTLADQRETRPVEQDVERTHQDLTGTKLRHLSEIGDETEAVHGHLSRAGDDHGFGGEVLPECEVLGEPFASEQRIRHETETHETDQSGDGAARTPCEQQAHARVSARGSEEHYRDDLHDAPDGVIERRLLG